MRRLLIPLVLAVVVTACGKGTTLPDDLADLGNAPTITGKLVFTHQSDQVLEIGGFDSLEFAGNATFAADHSMGVPVTYKLVQGTGYMNGKVVRYAGDVLCTYEGGREVQLVPGDGAFTIAHERYSGHIKLTVTYPVTPTCTAGGRNITLPEELLTREMDLRMEGPLAEGKFVGTMTPYDIGPLHCAGSWDMSAVS